LATTSALLFAICNCLHGFADRYRAKPYAVIQSFAPDGKYAASFLCPANNASFLFTCLPVGALERTGDSFYCNLSAH
jgi:hypothetical protein